MVCESLINSDTLEWERTQLWALTFKLVRKIIGGVDYKVSSPHSFLCDMTCFFLASFLGFYVRDMQCFKVCFDYERKKQFSETTFNAFS